MTKRPTGFRLEVQLDRVDTAGEIDCSLNEKRLFLKCPEKYFLEIDLKGDFEEEFKAQFNKKSKKLTLFF